MLVRPHEHEVGFVELADRDAAGPNDREGRAEVPRFPLGPRDLLGRSAVGDDQGETLTQQVVKGAPVREPGVGRARPPPGGGAGNPPRAGGGGAPGLASGR